jgi:peptide/nickel transport system substrate-binding protein
MKKVWVGSLVAVVFVFILLGKPHLLLAQTAVKKEAVKPAGQEQAVQPVKGGTLRGMRVIFPKNLGYVPDWAPADFISALPWAERLVYWDEKGGYVPNLLESWKVDPASKTITFHVRKGVQFTDGTPFDAASLKENLEFNLKSKRILDGEFIKSIDVVDKYTVRLNLSEVTSASMLNYAFNVQIVSVPAIEKNGPDWARKNGIGTGPFKLVDFKSDTYLKYVRNENYWRRGMPYIDAIQLDFVPDAVTAAMKMEAKEMDIWMDVPNVKMALDLQAKGLKINWGPGMLYALLPNTNKPKRPDAPLLNKKVREAIEFAIDRPALAKAIGFGQYEALTQIVPSFSPAYNPGFNPRPYNPEKAKQLLTESGYPNGFEIKMIANGAEGQAKDAATAIQSYLGAVGIKVNIDLADMGRYAAALFSPQGWDELALAASGIHPSGTDLYQHFGPRPLTYRFDYIKKTPEYLAACDKALHTYEEKAMKRAMQEIVKKASEDVMVIPVFRSAQPFVVQPWLHTEYPKRHVIQWNAWEDWMAKH